MKKIDNGIWIGILAFSFLYGLVSTEKYWQTPMIEFAPPSAYADSIGDKVTITTPDGKPISATNPLPTTSSSGGSSAASSTTSIIKGSTSNNGLEVNPNNSLPVEMNFATTSAIFNTINQELILATGGRNAAAFSLTSSGLTTVTITPYISVDGGLSYAASHLVNPATLAGSLTASFSGTSPSGTYFIGPVGPATHVKIKATSLSAGSSAVLNMSASWANTFVITTTAIPLQ